MFPTLYQEFIYKRTYSRWLDELLRREEWEDTVARYQEFFLDGKLKDIPDAAKVEFLEATGAIYNLEVMGSMRTLWTAGPALARENICGYNCAYKAVNTVRSFAEILYILLCGTGVGYSVERQEINQLPEVPPYFSTPERTVVFSDSKKGWAEGFLKWMNALYKGELLEYDLSRIRPAGSRLKTFGGRASGPEPLQELLEFAKRIFLSAKGRKLTSLECYDICCKIAEVVVVGGVRRSACICLTNLSDDRMAKAKTGEFWLLNPQRSLSNNSVAYTEKPQVRKFMSEWLKLMESQTGERGIFNRRAAEVAVQRTLRRKGGFAWGCNPCGEVILRPSGQFCNLSEAIIRAEDTLETILKKVRYATILGCVQATLTAFKFLGSSWTVNTEEERLLGVSLTGLMDHPILSEVSDKAKAWLVKMKGEAIETAERWSEILGIPMPKAITTVKPSGTVSQLVDSASGLHPRFAPFYVRRVRVSATDPVAKMLVDQGVPCSPEVGQDTVSPSTWVFEFPVKSPDNAKVASAITALEQLEYWLMLKQHWCEHNPSCTVYVGEDEWLEVGAWVWKHWDEICGLTFMPRSDAVYKLAPYEEVDARTYYDLVDALPDINFGELSRYETEDLTEGSREFACQGGACEL